MIPRNPSGRARSNFRHVRRNNRRRLFMEGLGSRRLLAGDSLSAASPWQNPEQPLDANRDQSITPLDFLVVANAIERQAHQEVPYADSVASRAPNLPAESGIFPDINGDRFITA